MLFNGRHLCSVAFRHLPVAYSLRVFSYPPRFTVVLPTPSGMNPHSECRRCQRVACYLPPDGSVHSLDATICRKRSKLNATTYPTSPQKPLGRPIGPAEQAQRHRCGALYAVFSLRHNSLILLVFSGPLDDALHRTQGRGSTERLVTPRFRGGRIENCAEMRGDCGVGVQTRYAGKRCGSRGEGCLLNCKRQKDAFLGREGGEMGSGERQRLKVHYPP